MVFKQHKMMLFFEFPNYHHDYAPRPTNFDFYLFFVYIFYYSSFFETQENLPQCERTRKPKQCWLAGPIPMRALQIMFPGRASYFSSAHSCRVVHGSLVRGHISSSLSVAWKPAHRSAHRSAHRRKLSRSSGFPGYRVVRKKGLCHKSAFPRNGIDLNVGGSTGFNVALVVALGGAR